MTIVMVIIFTLRRSLLSRLIRVKTYNPSCDANRTIFRVFALTTRDRPTFTSTETLSATMELAYHVTEPIKRYRLTATWLIMTNDARLIVRLHLAEDFTRLLRYLQNMKGNTIHHNWPNYCSMILNFESVFQRSKNIFLSYKVNLL